MISIQPRHVVSQGFFILLTLCFALFFAAHVHAQEQAQKLPVVSLRAGIHLIQAMVAQTEDERSTGLMYRQEMGPNEGMLFIFEQASTQCFWMKNTLLPLSAAFVRDDGSIVNIENMKPQTTNGHCSKEPVRFVLEMHEGWFAKRGFKPGSKLAGRPFYTHPN
jgi:uncharacterized protein